MNNTYGYSPELWSAAKKEAKQELISVAKREGAEGTITYSDLVARISSIHLEAHDPRLNALLGEISKDENRAGRGMLSVVVIRKDGSLEPGSGFFGWAQDLGYTVRDREGFLVYMVKKVREAWSEK